MFLQNSSVETLTHRTSEYDYIGDRAFKDMIMLKEANSVSLFLNWCPKERKFRHKRRQQGCKEKRKDHVRSQ